MSKWMTGCPKWNSINIMKPRNMKYSYLQDSHDDAAYHEGQKELPTANSVGFGEAADEEDQCSDEVDG